MAYKSLYHTLHGLIHHGLRILSSLSEDNFHDPRGICIIYKFPHSQQWYFHCYIYVSTRDVFLSFASNSKDKRSPNGRNPLSDFRSNVNITWVSQSNRQPVIDYFIFCNRPQSHFPIHLEWSISHYCHLYFSLEISIVHDTTLPQRKSFVKAYSLSIITPSVSFVVGSKTTLDLISVKPRVCRQPKD